MLIGYARVSMEKQDLNNQRREIENFIRYKNLGQGMDLFVPEVISSGKKDRKIFDLIGSMNENDTLLVYELSRIARNTLESGKIIEKIQAKNLSLYVIKDNIEILKGEIAPVSRLLVNMLFNIAEFERETIRQRVKSGLKARKEQGIKLGRPPRTKNGMEIDKNKIKRQLRAGKKQSVIAREHRISRQIVHNIAKSLIKA